MKKVLFLLMLSGISCSASSQCDNDLESQRKNLQGRAPISEKLLVDSAALISNLQLLSSDEFAGRRTATAGSLLAQKLIVKQLQTQKIDPTFPGYQQKFSYAVKNGQQLEGINLIGHIKGSKYPDSYIVLSAHYDHLGTKDGEIFNGADDNASGVSALLAMLQYFSKNQPEHSLMFAFFDSEEHGLQGSKYFVDHLPVATAAIHLNVNMDMISRNDKNNEVIVSGTFHSPELKPLLLPLQATTNIAMLYGHDQPLPCSLQAADWTYSSDHGSFHKKGIKFLYLGVEDSEDYHKPSDTFDKVDKSFFYRLTNLLTRVVIRLDTELK